MQPALVDGTVHVAFTSLLSIYDSLNALDDPYAIKLRSKETDNARLAKVNIAIANAHDQLKKFCNGARHIYDELGLWAANYYVMASISSFQDAFLSKSESLLGWTNIEKEYVANILARVLERVEFHQKSTSQFNIAPSFSPKVDILTQLLNAENKTNFSGLIFVERRATVAVMCHVLSHSPATRGWLRCSSFVGMSSSSNRKAFLGDLDWKAQKSALDEFREGSKNLLVCTSVLEEGIDVPSCHLVICFNKPPTLKSFIQRRGRARKSCSTYILMLPEDDLFANHEQWQDLEAEMVSTYQDDSRKLKEAAAIENIEETGSRSFRVESTGYVLRLVRKTGSNKMLELFWISTQLYSICITFVLCYHQIRT
jgi:ERCC4-related helicase